MAVLTFPFIPFPVIQSKGKTNFIYKPLVDIRLSYNHHVSPQIIPAVLDTGSEMNLIHSFLGQQLGIDIKKGKPEAIKGIGTIEIPTYRHQLDLFIGTFRIKNITVNFCDYQEYYQLVGLCSLIFFKKVIFDQVKKETKLYY